MARSVGLRETSLALAHCGGLERQGSCFMVMHLGTLEERTCADLSVASWS